MNKNPFKTSRPNQNQSTVRKKMATGTFTYNALRTNTLRAYKNTKKNCKSFKLDKSNAVSVEMTAIKPHLSICLVGLVCFAWYCGKIIIARLGEETQQN